MKILDMIILVGVALLAVIGIIRSLTREMTSVLAVILAVVLAAWMYLQGIQIVRLVSPKYQVSPVIGFGVAFASIYLMVSLLELLVRRFVVYRLRLRWLGGLGGGILGLTKQKMYSSPSYSC